jgi:2-polyprenyl-6-methoxyphenol hydroxylase-like FAD-dependent oxidoreductase
MNNNKSTKVLIAGAGPVGLSLAVDLGLRGIECVVAEKRDGHVAVPKMSQVSARNMEFCRRWGIADQVRNAVWSTTHPLDFVYITDLQGRELSRLKIPSYAEGDRNQITSETTSHCPQTYFDPIIVARAKSLPSVTLRTNIGLESFSQDGDAVLARLSDTLTGAEENYTADYLVGCDGPGGVVRPGLGIELDGLGAFANSINIFFKSPELASMHEIGWARFYRLIDEDSCWGELIPIDGVALWRLTVFHDDNPNPDTDAYLRKAAGCEFPYEIISILPWQRSDFVARQYGDGRVFIAGDAAHQCSPTGGLGMHTGVGEAVNLSWKLAAMLDGWGGEKLLSSYEAECQPIATRNVNYATAAYRAITGLPDRDAITDFLPANNLDATTEERRRLQKLTVNEYTKTQYCYEGSPICIPDGTPPLVDDPLSFTPSAQPGTRAPHGWLADNQSILDLFGDGFVMLCFGPDMVDASGLVEAAASRGVPLQIHRIDNDALAEIYQNRLALVRPDGHVAWRGDAVPAEPTTLIDRVRGA